MHSIVDEPIPNRKTARIAGALYLLSAAAAGVPLLYVPAKLIVTDNPAVTAHNILGSEIVFRACIVSELERCRRADTAAWCNVPTGIR